jgi:hypothetical protein
MPQKREKLIHGISLEIRQSRQRAFWLTAEKTENLSHTFGAALSSSFQ